MAKKSKYADWTKDELIKRIEALEKRKKYGLVWDEERTKEKFETDADGKLPVLKEVKSKEIKTDQDKPTHILIEGDNYHALSVLNYTHERAVDVIYIDPPYNTGNKDFRFNDSYVDREDPYRHSKWLSFMRKRLVLARNLLKDSGIIVVSIDDNELAQLRLLCNEVFFERNFVAILPTIMNLKGNQDQFGFAGTHEYTLVYCKDINGAHINHFNIDEQEVQEKWQEDGSGFFKRGANLKASGAEATRQDRPKMYFPVFVSKDDRVYVTEDDKPPAILKGKCDEIYPKTEGKEMRWRWEKKKFVNDSAEIIVVRNNGEISLYKKQRPSLSDLPSRKPKTLFYKPEYSSRNGTNLLKLMFGGKIFDNPKPLELIKDLIFLTTSKQATVLDFMAGSGTTGHSVLALNRSDGGKRQFILCTNNENNICSDVCYPRLQKVIRGFKKANDETVEGFGGNLKYYRTAFVPQEPTDKNKELLTKEAVEMLCLRENTFEFVSETDSFKLFKNKDHYTGIVFDQLAIPKFKKAVSKFDKPISVYVFSLGDDDFSDEFTDMKKAVRVCPRPEAILRVYRRIFK